MLIVVEPPTLLADLLGYLRRSGCIAYYVPGGSADKIEVLGTDGLGKRGGRELRRLLNRWQAGYPGAKVEIAEERP